jgi:hypothetical protein
MKIVSLNPSSYATRWRSVSPTSPPSITPREFPQIPAVSVKTRSTRTGFSGLRVTAPV